MSESTHAALDAMHEREALIAEGFTRSEALALMLTARGAKSVTVEVLEGGFNAEDITDTINQAVAGHAVAFYARLSAVLHEALASQLSREDIDRIVDRVAKGE